MQSMIGHTGVAALPVSALALAYAGCLTADRALQDRGGIG
jgi:hypothetical protein